MKFNKKFLLIVITLLLLSVIWISRDQSQPGKKMFSLYRTYKSVHEYDCVTSTSTKVAIIRSDDSTLINPVSINDPTIGYETIEEMVRRAVNLAGGFHGLIQSGNMVLLKPNIVDPDLPGSGAITDVCVIKALIKMIDEIDHGNIEIVIGEGSPRPMEYEMKYQNRFSSPQWQKLWDTAGYQDLLTDPYLEGINFRLSNLNGSPPEDPWQDLELVAVPNDPQADPQKGQYYIHKDVLNADVFITIPVMKIHSRTGITVALKNQIGLVPSTRYGFWKSLGVPQDNYKTRLIHDDQAPIYWTDKEIVDLSNIANIRFVIVDALACLETTKSARGNNLVRMNTIIAGADPVAVDHVCARLMGLNPDDIEHITLAEIVGLGTNDPDKITIYGADLDHTKKRFKKSSNNTADFGQGNRYWLLNGPYPIAGISDPINYQFIPNERSLAPEPGKDGWSEAIYFTNDRLDLNNYFSYPGKVLSYAFCYFYAPQTQEAELWIGSDEALKIYINGALVYSYNSFRSYPNDRFVSTKVKTSIKAGENRLLVKSLQKYGYYHFCLNICEPETNPDYDGNRIWGLKFKTESSNTTVKHRNVISAVTYKIINCYPNPFNHTIHINYQISNPGLMHIAVYNINGQQIRTLQHDNVNDIGEKMISWDGTDDYGNIMASGLYIFTLQSDNNSIISKKIMLIR